MQGQQIELESKIVDVEDGSPITAHLAAYLSSADDERPLYRKVADGLADVIAQHTQDHELHLPSERLLSVELGIARSTLRKALDELVTAGLLVRRHGAKTEVTRRVQKTLSSLTGFSQELRARGVEPGQKWLSRKLVHPTPSEAMGLGLSGTANVVRLERVRFADGKPIAIECAAIPAEFLASGELVGDSLYETLRELGATPVRGIQRIRAGVMNDRDADLLQRSVGDPILIIERRCFMANGRAVEFTETRYDGESYDFLTELQA